ncbi:hypothetical protein [Vibrio galatheae]|uniref:hypothetical protein n=1 Tax=Vibrio galatheae TaxID=579748 RepID=UPI000B1808D9|nr:hypothetical protein [Vibrio galatheae]
MKRLLTVLMAGLFSSSLFAGAIGSGEMGPFVDCEYPDGKRDYVPREVCKMQNGKIIY